MINLRSPYYVITQQANLTQVDIDIYIHTGTQSATVSGAQYSLSGTAVTPDTGNPYVVFEISELCRDYLTNSFDGTYDCSAVWINYQITTYTSGVADTPASVVQLQGFDGYQYFEEGEQSSATTYTAPDILQSNTVIYKSDDAPLRIPILQDNDPTIHFMYKGEVLRTVSITNTTTAADIIRYVKSDAESEDDFKARVEADSGTYERASLKNAYDKYSTQPVDAVIVDDGSTKTKLTVKNIPECKHTPYKLTFVNKFGAFQDVWFFKLSKLSMSTQSSSYRSNTQLIGTWSINDHSKKILSKNGSESLVMNSGFYPESYNEVFRQLLLSEEVWITYEDKVLPVNVSTGGIEYKTSVNDKLINYNIEVEFAFDKISNIR